MVKLSNILAGLKGIFHSRARKAAFLVAVIVGALAATVYAYYALLPPPAGPRVSITSPPLEFSIELNKAEFQYGENLTMIFTVKNISNETVIIARSYPLFLGSIVTESQGASSQPDNWLTLAFHFGFSITDINGTEVDRCDRGSLTVEYTVRIEGGGYIKQTYFWNRPLALGFLPSGVYQIRGLIYQFTVNGSWPPITLETPTITLTVK